MKLATKGTIALIITLALLVCGCQLIGANPTPPSKVERSIYQVKTNYVDKVITTTNYVTEVVQVPVKVTNEVNAIVWRTNDVAHIVQIPVTVTNTVEEYDYVIPDKTKGTASGIGNVVDVVFPGIGSIAASGVLALLAVWGKLRSTKMAKTATSMAQGIEMIREFIKTLPEGQKYDKAIIEFLKNNQMEAGVVSEVVKILENRVSNSSAKLVANELGQFIEVLRKQT